MTQPIDFKLDKNGDLIVPIEWVTGVEAVAQLLRIRVQLVAGEWFANLDAGIDWYGKILGQRYNDEVIRGEVRDAILATPGVGQIVSLSTDFDRATRTLTIAWRVRVDLDGLTGEAADSVEVAV